MQSYNLFKTMALLPTTFKHVLWVNQQLKSKSFDQLLHKSHQFPNYSASLHDIVKSYFWVCRIIPNCNCLPRSTALYQGLKGRGFDVEHKFGVNKTLNQFKAHAWVEFQGKPLNENPLLLKRFKVMNRDDNNSVE